jgi:hypothetical protein
MAANPSIANLSIPDTESDAWRRQWNQRASLTYVVSRCALLPPKAVMTPRIGIVPVKQASSSWTSLYRLILGVTLAQRYSNCGLACRSEFVTADPAGRCC